MRLTGVALVGALLLAPHAAVAADDTAVAQARVLFREGLKLVKAAQFEQARAKFAAANALVASDDILFNLALAEANSGHAADALNHYRTYARSPDARATDKSAFETKWVTLFAPRVGEANVDGADGETVTIDGQAIGTLPLATPYAVEPGHHVAEGHVGSEVVQREFAVTSGQTVAVHLAPPPAAPPVVAAVPPPPAPDPTPAPPASSDDESSHGSSGALRTGMTIGLGVGAVIVAAGGVYFGAKSTSAGNDANTIRAGLQPWSCGSSPAAACGQLSDDHSTANNDHTVSTVLYISAGVLVAGAVASFLFLPKASDTRSAIIPIVGPGVAGAGWATTF